MQTVSQDELRSDIARQCAVRGAKIALARKAGVSPSLISDVLSRRREIPEVLANALGYARPSFFISIRD